MQYGYRIIDDLVLGLQNYMAERGIQHLSDLVGEELPSFDTPTNLDRDTIVYPTFDREKCIGCGRCYTSCQDGGHQAIAFVSLTLTAHAASAVTYADSFVLQKP